MLGAGTVHHIKFALMQRSKTDRYSITSSAIASTFAGIVRPNALAVLRLMTSWKVVGRNTGNSAGFAPLRMRPV